MEDLLPKMICFDCQRNIEQFYSFRLMCHRVERKLLKLVLPGGNKLLPGIKEELADAETENGTAISYVGSDHTYGAPPLLPRVPLVKREIEDEHPTEPETEQGDSDFIQIIYDGLLRENPFAEMKEPIIDIIVDGNVGVNELEEPWSKIEVDVLPNETKPVVECRPIEEVPLVEDAPNAVANHKKRRKRKVVEEFNWDNVAEKYFYLADGEECNIDLEEMEAVVKKNENPNMKFQCSTCEKTFKYFKGMRKHRQSHEQSDQKFFCNFCKEEVGKSYEFSSMKCLKAHIMGKHLIVKNYSCANCGEKFRTKVSKNKHIVTVHNPENYECQECSKIFKKRRLLREHLRLHSDEKPYICEICGRGFRWSTALRAHQQAHLQEKNFLCAECGTKFSSKAAMIEHFNIHRGVRPFSCSNCDATFPHVSSLSKHSAKHKPTQYLCDVCGKGFSKPLLLKQHEFHHTGARPFSCSVCGSVYRTRSDLCNHLKIHGEKRFKCDFCELKFTRRGHLKDHIARHTGAKHVCPVPFCNKTYTQRTPLCKHFRKKHPELALGKRRGGHRLGEKRDESVLLEVIHYDCLPKEATCGSFVSG